jgi:hypothetical protein
MTQDPMKIGLEFLNDALEREFKLSLYNFDLEQSACGDQEKWDELKTDKEIFEQRMAMIRPIKKLRKVKLQNHKMSSRLLEPARWESLRAKRRQRKILKASLYAHPSYGFVVRCLISNCSPVISEDILNARWDVVVTPDGPALANTVQIICSQCGGMSGVTGENCVEGSGSWGLGGCQNGFVGAPTHKIGKLDSPLEICRFGIWPQEKYKALYDAEV